MRPGGRVVIAYGGRFASSDWDFWFDVLGRHAHRGTREPNTPCTRADPRRASFFVEGEVR